MTGINRITKALEDRVIAALILVCISPLLLLIALGVKLTSRGPVFFRQERHGWDGRIIKVYKFRTMYLHAEAEGKVTQATAHDPRITPFGRFLRRTSLDELPQFINVLQGRMSIVGPRPHAVAHNEQYKRDDPHLHAASSRETRHHWLGAGEWLARRNRYVGKKWKNALNTICITLTTGRWDLISKSFY